MYNALALNIDGTNWYWFLCKQFLSGTWYHV